MLLESKTIQLGDEDFQITQFTATKGLKFFRLITKYAGPLIGLMGAKAGDGDAVNQAIEALMDNMDDDKIDSLIKDMITSSAFTPVIGQPVKFDYFFAGEYGKLITLITEIVTYNFGSAFQSSVLENLSAQLPTQG